jgi:hypothetical protein
LVATKLVLYLIGLHLSVKTFRQGETNRWAMDQVDLVPPVSEELTVTGAELQSTNENKVVIKRMKRRNQSTAVHINQHSTSMSSAQRWWIESCNGTSKYSLLKQFVCLNSYKWISLK